MAFKALLHIFKMYVYVDLYMYKHNILYNIYIILCDALIYVSCRNSVIADLTKVMTTRSAGSTRDIAVSIMNALTKITYF